MGTSGSSKGPGSNTPLVPTWLDTPKANSPTAVAVNGVKADSKTKPNIPTPTQGKRFKDARTAFTKFVKSGGSDSRSLKKAISKYVSQGVGGKKNATRRMGSSLASAGNVLRVLRDIQNDGIQRTLEKYSLNDIENASAEEILTSFTEIICKDGGSIDEALAREAWLETIVELADWNLDDLSTLSLEKITTFVITFIALTVEKMIIQSIGNNGFKLPENNKAVANMESQLKSYIRVSVQDSFKADLSNLSRASDTQINDLINKTYEDSWELLEVLGEENNDH